MGITPICDKKPSTSFSDHVSTSLPSAMRWIVMAIICKALPVRGAPGNAFVLADGGQARHHLIAFR
jgi:hypothetical protein